MNQVILPVTYNDKFYKDVLDVGELAKLGKNLVYSVWEIAMRIGEQLRIGAIWLYCGTARAQ